MNYIVLDLEWNQAPGKIDKGCGVPFEIVEIGAVKLDKKLRVVDKYEQIIKPQIYRTIHYMTSKIVHLDEEALSKGRPFPEVMEEFLKWCGNDYRFCIWGTLDLTELQRNMCYYGMDELTTKPLPFLDIQKLYSLAYEDGKIRRALEFAIDELNISKEEAFHRAYSDAFYTALVFERIKQEHPQVEDYLSYDLFMLPQNKRDEVHAKFKTYTKYISREFVDKKSAMADRTVASMRCYHCARNTRKIIKWFSVNGHHYYAVGYCKRHGYIKGKVRMKKADDGNVYVVKTLKVIPEESVLEIKEKQEKLRQQRAERRHNKSNSTD